MHKPWKPVPYESADVAALQALANGNANEGQQERALQYIIHQVCGTYDQSYHPGEEGRRDTDFAEGRRFVGNTIIKMTKLPLSAINRKEDKRG